MLPNDGSTVSQISIEKNPRPKWTEVECLFGDSTLTLVVKSSIYKKGDFREAKTDAQKKAGKAYNACLVKTALTYIDSAIFMLDLSVADFHIKMMPTMGGAYNRTHTERLQNDNITVYIEFIVEDEDYVNSAVLGFRSIPVYTINEQKVVESALNSFLKNGYIK